MLPCLRSLMVPAPGAPIVQMPWQNVDVYPASSSWPMESRDTRKVGLWRALISMPPRSTVPWWVARTLVLSQGLMSMLVGSWCDAPESATHVDAGLCTEVSATAAIWSDSQWPPSSSIEPTVAIAAFPTPFRRLFMVSWLRASAARFRTGQSCLMSPFSAQW